MPPKKLPPYMIFPLFAVLLMPSNSLGRENHLQGTFNVLESYDSNITRNTEEIPGWTTTISPAINFLSQGQHDSISFYYAPGLRINDRQEQESTFRDNHNLQINAEKTMARDFQFSLSETFILTNDPYLQYQYVQDPELEGHISEKVAKRTFSRNTATTSIGWNYTRDSSLTLSGTHYIYDQKDDWREGDYNRLQGAASLEHRLTRKWHGALSYLRSQTDFKPAAAQPSADDPEAPVIAGSQPADIENSRTQGRLAFMPSPHSTLSASGYLNKFKFEAVTGGLERENYDIYHAQLGWRQTMGRHLTMFYAAGKSLVDMASSNNLPSLFYEGELTVNLEQTTMNIQGQKGFRNRYYSGTNDGLSEYWTVNTSLNYQLTQGISVSISGSYFNDTFISRDGNPDEEQILVGIDLSYALNRWATLMLRYNYRSLTPSDYDGYKVNRLFLEVRASNELWRW